MYKRIKGYGTRPNLVMWLGGAPVEDDLRSGILWSGKAGKIFNNLMVKEGLDRSDFYITSLRKSIPGEGESHLAEWDAFDMEYMQVEPSIVVTMGLEATRVFLGDVDLEAVHGIPWRVPAARWDRLELVGRPPVVVPMYSPAYALVDADAFSLIAWDIMRVRDVLGGKVPPREIRDEFPKPHYTLGFVPYFHPNVYVDTEGWKDLPYCLSYSCRPGRAHVILARDTDGLAKFKDWLSRRKKVIFHSAMYDLAVMRAMGIEVRDDQLGDTKVKVYVGGGIEPPGLKPLAFRHACMTMTEYTDLTAPYDFCQAMDYLLAVSEDNWGKPDPIMEKNNAGLYKVTKPQGLNTALKKIFTSVASGKGETDPRKRWFKIPETTRAPAEAKYGPMPRFTLDQVPIDDVVQYAARDADATCRIDAPLTDMVANGKHGAVYQMDIDALPIVERMQANGVRIQQGYFPKLAKDFDREMDRVRKEIESYYGGKSINPGSSDQTADLIFNRLGLPILKWTAKKKPSTQDKVLEALKGRHPAVALICDWRELATLKDKFSTKLPDYMDPDGRVRGTIRDTTVVSGRYSMSEPNLMAIPTRSKLGKKIREGFIASPGCILVSADFDQVEMRVMADESGEESMISAFNEGRDIHGENACMIFGVSMDKVSTPEGKLIYRYPAKRIGFGIITGITGAGLFDQMRLAGIHKYSVADCDEMIQNYLKARPAVARYLRACRNEVERLGYVRERFGRIRYLPGVYSYHPGVSEEARRQSHSHKISGAAQGLKKRALKRIWDRIKDMPRGECEPLLEIHDEFLLEVKLELREWAEKMLVEEMSKDSHLFRVPITAKAGSGPNWGVLKD